MKYEHTSVAMSVRPPPYDLISAREEHMVPLYSEIFAEEFIEDVLPPLYFKAHSNSSFYTYQIPASGANRRPEFTIMTGDNSVKVDMCNGRSLLIISFPDDANISTCNVKKVRGYYVIIVHKQGVKTTLLDRLLGLMTL